MGAEEIEVQIITKKSVYIQGYQMYLICSILEVVSSIFLSFLFVDIIELVKYLINHL